MTRNSETVLFLPRPSFVEGFSRILDLGCSLRNAGDARSERDADAAAMLSDWWATGDDLRVAIESYGERIRSTRTR